MAVVVMATLVRGGTTMTIHTEAALEIVISRWAVLDRPPSKPCEDVEKVYMALSELAGQEVARPGPASALLKSVGLPEFAKRFSHLTSRRKLAAHPDVCLLPQLKASIANLNCEARAAGISKFLEKKEASNLPPKDKFEGGDKVKTEEPVKETLDEVGKSAGKSHQIIITNENPAMRTQSEEKPKDNSEGGDKAKTDEPAKETLDERGKSAGKSNQITPNEENPKDLTMRYTQNEEKPKDKFEGGDKAMVVKSNQITTTNMKGFPSQTDSDRTEERADLIRRSDWKAMAVAAASSSGIDAAKALKVAQRLEQRLEQQRKLKGAHG